MKSSRAKKTLGAKNLDAEKHPKGFKQLEISLRQSLRRLNNLLPVLTADEQAPFLEVRADLEEMNRHLNSRTFPPLEREKQADFAASGITTTVLRVVSVSVVLQAVEIKTGTGKSE